jgi:hypothetical protein
MTARFRVVELVVPDGRNVICRNARIRFKRRAELVESTFEGWKSVFGSETASAAMSGYVEML